MSLINMVAMFNNASPSSSNVFLAAKIKFQQILFLRRTVPMEICVAFVKRSVINYRRGKTRYMVP